ncbi:MAG: MinD/ParA family protein [Spirochaetaceae bacterium]|nr:MinD/ParA family protein [Spirochaetaceae bacterium]MBP5328678.1 MinD/ParA family protein [Spirochaetaceae bacterium]
MEDQAAKLREMMKQTSRKTRIITVTSGKGGVGKTNLSVNLAIAYAQIGKKVILIDADLGLANVNVILNMIPQYNLYHVITKQKRMSEIILPTEYGIKIIAGANGFSKIANLSDEDRGFFIQEFETLSSADIIIIDTSAGISSNVLGFVEAADEVLIVTTPEPTAITDAYGMIKIIATETDSIKLNLKLIVNRVHSAAEGKRISDRMTTIVGQFLNCKVEYMGFIYDDPAVPQAVVRQKPFIIAEPASKPAMCVKHIVSRIEKIDIEKVSGVSGFIDKLLGRDWSI